MKIELKELGPLKRSLFIEAEPDEVRQETESVLRRYASQVRLPGFRPGKAPVSLIRTRFAREIKEDVRDRLISRLHGEATAQKGLRPLGDPLLDDVSQPDDGSLRFRTTFEIVPELTPKGYRGVEVREPAVRVSDQDVEQMLEDLRKSHVKLVSEEGRAATTGDLVAADVVATPEDGEAFRREGVLIEVGATDNLPEFNERLLGATAGAVLEFATTYPKEYEAKHLAGKTVQYRMEIRDVKRREYPELDDEFAKDLGEFDDLSALRERIRKDLTERGQLEARQTVRQAVLDKVLLENPVPLPEILVDEEIQHRLEEIVRGLMMRGIDPKKAELDWDTLRKQQDEPARKTVHARLLLDAVASAEAITAELAEVEARIRKEAERLGQPLGEVRERLAKGGGLEALRNQMVREKSLDFLTSVANIHPEG